MCGGIRAKKGEGFSGGPASEEPSVRNGKYIYAL